MSSPPSLRHGLLVPVKAGPAAKSRLGLEPEVRARLATAFALDTVAAALESPAVDTVLAVTDDHVLASQLSAAGAHVIPDGVADDLNATLVQAAHELRRLHPGLAIAAMPADLPCLRHRDLTAALEMAASCEVAFVADEAGSGTTLLAARDVSCFDPRFGPGSREAHLAAGAVELMVPAASSLRRDVDTLADLAEALAFGVGRHTAEAGVGLRL